MAIQYSILLVDDEPDILEILEYNLRKEGYEIFTATNGKEAIDVALEKKPDIVILDYMMPLLDGIATCKELRKIKHMEHAIIAFLTARGDDYSEIAGLEAGADDYIVKPIRPQVIITRLQTLLKRKQIPKKTNTLAFQEISINVEKHIVYFNNAEFILPNKEFKLLELLISNPERVFTREEIYNSVWGQKVIVGDRTIDVHIRKLREKFNDEYIETIKGIGYSLQKKRN